MKMLMLRGQVPTDRNPKEIIYKTRESADDVWILLADAMTGKRDTTKVLYWRGDRTFFWGDNFTITWTPSFKKYRHRLIPDVIFFRGGFKEYNKIYNLFPECLKIYYGAGVRTVPDRFYDIVLVDDTRDVPRVIDKHPASRVEVWAKPAADPIFFPHDVKNEFDVCYIANGGQAEIKRIPWVYKTVPSDLKVLHLGIKSKFKPPKNVTCKRVLRTEMAREISRCKVGIVPYSSYDSGPRVIPEMLACNVPVVTAKSTRSYEYEWSFKSPIKGIWNMVGTSLYNVSSSWDCVREDYLKHHSIEMASTKLRGIIAEELLKKERNGKARP